ncbi:MAG: glycosyltransferase family 2 protein [Mycoplasmatales bacterium]|nr:glycosyltransferase family 2 protein [Mycoplasmatales bacterium]
MNKKILLSIAIPIYNMEKWLPITLKSLEEIKDPNNEIQFILMDDGSKDSSKEICMKQIKKDARFEYHYHDNMGLHPTRQESLKFVKGKYGTFLDSDDLFTPNLLDELKKAIHKNSKVDAIAWKTKRIDEEGEEIKYPIYSQNTKNKFVFFNSIPYSRSSTIVRTNSDEFKMLGEIDRHIKIMSMKQVEIIDETIYEYRKVSTSLSRTHVKRVGFHTGFENRTNGIIESINSFEKEEEKLIKMGASFYFTLTEVLSSKPKIAKKFWRKISKNTRISLFKLWRKTRTKSWMYNLILLYFVLRFPISILQKILLKRINKVS